jgi:DNA processing protein
MVTEAPCGITPQARCFSRRNCIIAGRALGVVVVEAALRSGSLITAWGCSRCLAHRSTTWHFSDNR